MILHMYMSKIWNDKISPLHMYWVSTYLQTTFIFRYFSQLLFLPFSLCLCWWPFSSTGSLPIPKWTRALRHAGFPTAVIMVSDPRTRTCFPRSSPTRRKSRKILKLEEKREYNGKFQREKQCVFASDTWWKWYSLHEWKFIGAMKPV